MQAAPAAPERRLTASDFAGRFTMIAASLVALIARGFLRNPSLAPLIIPLCRRITRTARRLATLMAQLTAGQLPTPRIRPRHPGGHTAKNTIPVTGAWLVRTLQHEAAGLASQLAHLLAEPDVSDLLDAAPAARRLLRPLCRMLGLPDTARCAVARQATSDTPLRGVAGQAAGAPLRPESPDTAQRAVATQATGVFVFKNPESAVAASLRPPLCPRLLLRWPWAPHPGAKPA